MCGIVGIVSARGSAPPAREGVEAALRALEHRGPDGSGIHAGDAAIVAQTRLAIVDLVRGDQPMWNEDRSVVTVYNGEIWNFPELRRELERAGHVFATHADTEVLVHGYEEWGEDLPRHVNGMFAFAIWDERRERLLLARDRVGKKPLYLARARDGVVFGSDIRSVLLAGGLRPELDRERVPEYLFARYVSAPATLVRGVEKLRPGHALVYDRETVREHAYWRLDPGDPEPLQPRDLRELLVDSARRRLMSDVPLGVLLSGGVDSAAVLGLMREAGAGEVASFTIGFDDPLHDERQWARATAERHGSDHHEVVVDRAAFVEALPRLAWYRDEPVAEPSEIPLLLLAEFAGRHVKVVLSGDGGDELFGGYPKYRAERILRAAGPLGPTALRLATRALALRPSHRRLDRAVETLAVRDELLRWASWFRTFSPQDVGALVAPDLRPHATPAALVAPLARALEPYAALDPGRRMLVGDFHTYLAENMLLRSDKVLMAASLEGRMPLLDYRIVERVANVPASARAGIRSGKAILRDAVRDLVPDEVLNRPKRGFPVPTASFLAASAGIRELVLSDRALDRGLFDRTALVSLVERGRDLELFTLAMLELHLRTNVDEVTERPPADAGDDVLTAPAAAAHA